MKILFTFLFIVFFIRIFPQSGVAINESGISAASSAMFDVQSNSKGILIPRMNTAQRTTISNPANGLLVFDTDTESFWFFGTGWTELINSSNAGWEKDADTLSTAVPLVGIGTGNPSRMLTLSFNNANINTSQMLIEQAGSGDAWINFGLTGAKHYALGIDNSDNDKFKIGYSATGPGGVHVNTRLTLDTLGNLGLGVSSPVTRLQVNSLSGQNPFRADIAGTTRFQVNSNGGTAIGSGITPPVNGLRVSGIIEPVGGISYSGDLNVTSTTGFISITAGASEIKIYANGQIDITAAASLNITASSDLSLSASGNLDLSGNTITIVSTGSLNLDSGNSLSLESSTNTAINANGSITIDANGAMDVLSGNTMDIQNSAGTMNVKNLGGNMNVQAASTLNLDGGVIDINNGSQGAARTLDAVGGGVIVSGSSSVKIGN